MVPSFTTSPHHPTVYKSNGIYLNLSPSDSNGAPSFLQEAYTIHPQDKMGTPSHNTSPAAALLGRQLKQMRSDKDIPGISCGTINDNLLEWEVTLMINEDCRFYGGNTRNSSTPSPFQKKLEKKLHKANLLLFLHRRHLPRQPDLPPGIPPPAPPHEIPPALIPPQHLPLGRSLHLDPAPPGRRQIRLRVRQRTVESGAIPRNDPVECD